jgi:hypothetical protein
MTARILLQGPTVGRLRFQPSRSAPSLPHQVPNEQQRTQAPESVDTGRASALTH